MKNHIIISLLFLSIGFSQKEYNNNNLVEMDNGFWTLKFSKEPISGKVYGLFGEVKPYKKVYMGNLRKGKREGKWVFYYQSTGKKKYEYYFKDGKQNGLFTKWSKSGKKVFTKTLKDGKKHGLYIEWWPNGKSKSYEGTFKDEKQDGLFTKWYENGQKKEEGTYKNEKIDGLNTEWHENGQKSKETTYKNVKKDGVQTQWYENGQKKFEWTYRDGKIIGLWTEWWSNGHVKEEGIYKDGIKKDVWTSRNEMAKNYLIKYTIMGLRLREQNGLIMKMERKNLKKITKMGKKMD